MAAVPSIGRAVHVEGSPAPEADLTRALYERYAHQILRYCLHQLGSREEAEDAVQSTFLNAFRGITRGVVPELESAWLFKIAHNVCLSRRRTSWRRGRIESPADFEVVQELTPAPSRRADELMGLQDVLEQMPETQRRAILLREWQGLSYREIADELELTQAAVETLIFRARRSLAAGLEQPPERKRRLVRGADLGNLFAGLKTLLAGGGAAVKVAATVAMVSAGTVAVAAPVQQHHRSHTPARRSPAASDSLPAQSRTATVVATSAGPASAFPGVAPKRHLLRESVPPAASTPSGAPGTLAPDPAPAAPVEVTPPPPAAPASEPQRAPESQRSEKSSSAPDKSQGADRGRSGERNGSTPAAPATAAPTPATSESQRNGNDSKGGDSRGNDKKDSTSAPAAAAPATAAARPATSIRPVPAQPSDVAVTVPVPVPAAPSTGGDKGDGNRH